MLSKEAVESIMKRVLKELGMERPTPEAAATSNLVKRAPTFRYDPDAGLTFELQPLRGRFESRECAARRRRLDACHNAETGPGVLPEIPTAALWGPLCQNLLRNFR